MDVLLVAAKKEKIADYTGVISQAGRVPVVVDVDAFALQNAYEMNYGLEPGHVVVLLNAGASAININILSGDQSLFTRDISVGGNAYTEAVQKELGLPFESAELVKKGHPVEGASFEDVKPVLHAMTENVLLEVQKTFDFFKATASSDRIDRIMLSGGASKVDGFAAALEERFGSPVEAFDPFKNIGFDPAKLGVADAEALVADRGGCRRPRPQKGGRPMIRINLLSVERERAKKKVTFQSGQKMVAGCTMILILAGLFMGWRFLVARARVERARRADRRGAAGDDSACTRSSSRCRSSSSSARSSSSAWSSSSSCGRIRPGPVHMLDQISRALPPMLWLTELKQGADANEVVISGRCTTLTGLSDFVSNLESSGYFKRSIEIVNTTTESVKGAPNDVVKFSIKAIFQQPGAAKPAAPPAAKTGG